MRRALAVIVALAAGCSGPDPGAHGRGAASGAPVAIAAAPATATATARDAVAVAYAEPGPAVVDTIDLELADAPRARTLPVRLRVPRPCDAATRRPLVLFSHGLGGSRDGGAAWGAHWAGHGLVVLHLQHPGSDASLWRGRGFGIEALRPGMTATQYVARIDDVRAAIDRIAALAASRPEFACIDVGRVGLSGHSFGARTTLAVAGQSLPAFEGRAAGPWARDRRVVAAIAFSPSLPGAAGGALAGVEVPLLAISGSLDGDVVGSGATPAARRAVYDALPSGRRALLWLEGADHGVFNGGRPRPATAGVRPDLEVQRAARAITLAFWRATLLADASARAWLDGAGPRTLLDPADEWRPH